MTWHRERFMLRSHHLPATGLLLPFLVAASSMGGCTRPQDRHGTGQPNGEAADLGQAGGSEDAGPAQDSNDGSADPGCSLECPEGELLCDCRCIDPGSDPEHCGVCEQGCEEGQSCAQGQCVSACEDELERCGPDCVDLQSDRRNCGRCGEVCGPGLRCYEGACAPRCPEEWEYRCEEECTSLLSDDQHCGRCHNACRERETCREGRCEPMCSGDQAYCRGICVDLQTNPHHCGACGNQCAVEMECYQGECVEPCGERFERCEGHCINTAVDPANCGGCARVCDPWLVCQQGLCVCEDPLLVDCRGACRDLSSDLENCGECDLACDPDKTCIDGDCVCPEEGWEVCEGLCVDLMNDESNCGECGVRCEPEEECRFGRCGGPEIFPGVRMNLPEADLRGWELCFNGLYGERGAQIQEILASCDRPFLMLACRPLGSDTLTVAAAGERDHVLHDTGNGRDSVHEHNGVNWYFSQSHSWGFVVAGESVSRNSCDTADTRPETRLCWHTGNGALSGGWRCGSNTGLNSNNDWERLVYH